MGPGQRQGVQRGRDGGQGDGEDPPGVDTSEPTKRGTAQESTARLGTQSPDVTRRVASGARPLASVWGTEVDAGLESSF